MRAIRGILLDIDGTMVDSNDAHAHAWIEALAQSGHTVELAMVRPLIGMGGDKLLPMVCGIEADSAEGKQIDTQRAAIFREEYLPTIKPCRGAEELLALLKKHKFLLGVATSSKKDELDPLLKICGADRYIEAATSSDDAENSKPDPDIVKAALAQLNLAPDEAVLLGDTPYDMKAGQHPGIKVIALRCGGWQDLDLQVEEIYDDPADLIRHFDHSLLSPG